VAPGREPRVQDLTDPVLTSFLVGVLTRNPKGPLNKDLISLLAEYSLQAQQERVEIGVVRKRALRAFELAFAAVLSVDLMGLELLPYLRASLETLDIFVDRMRVRVDDAVVFNVELSFGEEAEKKGPKQMKRMEMLRLHAGGLRLLGEVETLRGALKNPDSRYILGVMGVTLASVCADMAIGLSKQALFAEQLLHA
jgi:hypothetical protein